VGTLRSNRTGGSGVSEFLQTGLSQAKYNSEDSNSN
jgi:hypothetical protein